jgi:hypothetical protein
MSTTGKFLLGMLEDALDSFATSASSHERTNYNAEARMNSEIDGHKRDEEVRNRFAPSAPSSTTLKKEKVKNFEHVCKPKNDSFLSYLRGK